MGGMKEEGSPTKILWGLTYVRGGRGVSRNAVNLRTNTINFAEREGGGQKIQNVFRRHTFRFGFPPSLSIPLSGRSVHLGRRDLRR